MPITVHKFTRTGWLWFLKRQKYWIIDGHMRFQAVLHSGQKRLYVRVLPEGFTEEVRVKDVLCG